MTDFRALLEDGRRTKRGTGEGGEGGLEGRRRKRRKTEKKARKKKTRGNILHPKNLFS